MFISIFYFCVFYNIWLIYFTHSSTPFPDAVVQQMENTATQFCCSAGSSSPPLRSLKKASARLKTRLSSTVASSSRLQTTGTQAHDWWLSKHHGSCPAVFCACSRLPRVSLTHACSPVCPHCLDCYYEIFMKIGEVGPKSRSKIS